MRPAYIGLAAAATPSASRSISAAPRRAASGTSLGARPSAKSATPEIILFIAPSNCPSQLDVFAYFVADLTGLISGPQPFAAGIEWRLIQNGGGMRLAKNEDLYLVTGAHHALARIADGQRLADGVAV